MVSTSGSVLDAPRAAGAAMNGATHAFRFGLPGEQRYAIFHEPAAAPRAEAVLLCNPFGQEAIRSHRLFRVLAERLARAGFAVLRFDYRGTGDADGDDEDGDLPRWTDDVLAADAELGRRTGHVRSWVGLRLGATLAALASGRSAVPPRRLVLWSPVTDGSAYLRELGEAHAAELKSLHGDPRPDRRPSPDPAFALGYALPATLRAQLRSLVPATPVTPRAGAVTCLVDDTGADDARPAVPGAALVRLPTRTVWASDEAMSTSIVPADGLQAVVAALGSPA